jgi:hypothetical protein
VFVVGVLLAGVVIRNERPEPRVESAPASQARTAPPPMAATPSVLSTEVKSELTDLVLSPPPAGTEPNVSAEDARDKAWAEEGAEGNPTSVQLTYATLNWGKYVDTPVWLLTYKGTCIPVGSGVGSEGEEPPKTQCRRLDFHTLMNADSGDYIASFVDSSVDV